MQERELIEQLSRGTVAIIGDVMLDHYVFGGVGRISPEAPVPVLHVTHERHVLGAAANVAANVAALGGKAHLVGLIGQDAHGVLLRALVQDMAGVTPALVETANRATIVKTRYVSGQQQIVRVDRESTAPLAPDLIEALKQAALPQIQSCGCVILSDYGKSVLNDEIIAFVLETARSLGKRILVDPKRRTFEAYRGADYITPNRKELTDATGMPCSEDDEAARAADQAIEQTGAAILLTRSERGMSLFRRGVAPIHLSAEAREVFDVSGAGDTVVATVATALAAGAPIEQSLRLANAAAGVVVSKLGTAVCSAQELGAALERSASRRPEGRGAAKGLTGPASWDEAARVRAQWKREGLTVGFANGCFDLLHPGHVSLLQQAAEACDRLIVAINSDASVQALKGPTRPIQKEVARAQVLQGLKGVDLVVVFGEPTPLELITHLMPDVVIKGADYTEDQVVGGDVVKAAGGRVVLIELVEGQSTTALVKRATPTQ